MHISSKAIQIVAAITLASAGGIAIARANPMVGGAAMYPTRNIVENAVNSKDHTTLVAAVKAAGLVDTLSGKGPFTVFAPTNEAFGMLPAGTVDTLLKPENKAMLTKVLTYHVVPGKHGAMEIAAMAKKHGGKAMFTTVEGEPVTLTRDSMGGWWIADAKGGKAKITIADVSQSNGVIHVIDKVLMP
ncbi:fasciclin domain-containing protein [Sphingobium nicotianae]|uniref:Fasciclin domain-containing protein n=1 Tax=Sphingobium nicotianae TaxID=2782607 RepID=A0A9X1DB48_9SPHN|nr:fasciclin domain-containing protein [Sphingobium nicotianae]MBT2186731.1 fasciclin domain-containing protein [Sphingobium nicotianae]